MPKIRKVDWMLISVVVVSILVVSFIIYDIFSEDMCEGTIKYGLLSEKTCCVIKEVVSYGHPQGVVECKVIE